MANICDVTATICGTQEEIKRLYNIVKDSSHGDLCDIVNALGGNADEVYCRASIYDYDYEDYGTSSELHLYIESAWREPYEVFEFLQEQMPGITIYYIAEEDGCGYHATNDPNAPMFKSDFNCEVEYHESLQDLLDYAESTYERKFATLEALDEYLNEADKGDFYGEFIYCQSF